MDIIIIFKKHAYIILLMSFSGFLAVNAQPNAKDADITHMDSTDPSMVGTDANYDEIISVLKKLDTKSVYTLKEYSPEKLKALKRVRLSKSSVSDEDLKKLSQLSGVWYWNLGACSKLTPESVLTLKQMTSARIMDLVNVKIFKDYDEVVSTFENHKDLELLSFYVKGKAPTEKFNQFLKDRPNLKVLHGPYRDIRDQHKKTCKEITQKWYNDGLLTEEDVKISFEGVEVMSSDK